MKQTFSTMLVMAVATNAISIRSGSRLMGDVGQKIAVKCSDGFLHVCQGGTEGCHDNGDVCKKEVGTRGFLTQIHCNYDDTNHFCHKGTEGCGDDQQPYCVPPNKSGLAQTGGFIFAQAGKKEARVCADGSIRACTLGTEIGCDVKGPLCDAKRGYETQIVCNSNGETHFCNSGTQGCVDDSETLCPAVMGAKKTVKCEDGSVRACSEGTQKGCDLDEVCDLSMGY